MEHEPRAQETNKIEENNNVSSLLHGDDYVEEIQKELIELRCQLERERRLRINVEEKKRQLQEDADKLRKERKADDEAAAVAFRHALRNSKWIQSRHLLLVDNLPPKHMQ